MPQQIRNVIIHESDSFWGTAEDIRHWHTDPIPKGRGWKVPGYHLVVLNRFPSFDSWTHLKPVLEGDGMVQSLVPLNDDDWLESEEVGNHVLGMNSFSVGICCISKCGVYTWRQIDSLKDLCWDLLQKHQGLHPDSFLGHYETETGKAQGKSCPGFDMSLLRASLMDRIRLKTGS